MTSTASELEIASLRPNVVTPAKAGVQEISESLDSGFRRNDGEDHRISAAILKNLDSRYVTVLEKPCT
jgi:hypothetical protein